MYVGYLRNKLEANRETRLIHTVRGVGYVLREPTTMSLRLRLTLFFTVVLAASLLAFSACCTYCWSAR